MIGSVRAGTRPPDGLARRFRSVRADALAIGHDPAGLAPPGPKLVHVAPFPPPPPPPVSGQSWRRALVFEPTLPPSWLYGNAFLDQNANGVYDEPSELGAVLAEQGATGTALAAAEGTSVDSDLTKEYADEFSASVEHELAVDTSLRVSWFYRRFD